MSEKKINFDCVLVMDPLLLTGAVICNLTDEMIGKPCSEHVTSIESLRQVLLQRHERSVLVIMELQTEENYLREGLDLLSDLTSHNFGENIKVMVFTSVTEPLLLKVIVNRFPAAIVLRKESIDIIRQAILMADVAAMGTILSPAVTEGLELARDVCLTRDELEDFVLHNTCIGYRESARLMGVGYKKLQTWRLNIAHKKEHRLFTLRYKQISNQYLERREDNTG